MTTFKSKSLSPDVTDREIETGCHTIRFISFESCIQLFRQERGLMGLKDKPKGYRVTEQGIEIIFD
jgi:hypothetical protein